MTRSLGAAPNHRHTVQGSGNTEAFVRDADAIWNLIFPGVETLANCLDFMGNHASSSDSPHDIMRELRRKMESGTLSRAHPPRHWLPTAKKDIFCVRGARLTLVWKMELGSESNQRMWEREGRPADLQDGGPCHPDCPPELSAEEEVLSRFLDLVYEPMDKRHARATQRERNSANRREQARQGVGSSSPRRPNPAQDLVASAAPSLRAQLQPPRHVTYISDAPPGIVRPSDLRLGRSLGEDGREITDLLTTASASDSESDSAARHRVGDEYPSSADVPTTERPWRPTPRGRYPPWTPSRDGRPSAAQAISRPERPSHRDVRREPRTNVEDGRTRSHEQSRSRSPTQRSYNTESRASLGAHATTSPHEIPPRIMGEGGPARMYGSAPPLGLPLSPVQHQTIYTRGGYITARETITQGMESTTNSTLLAL